MSIAMGKETLAYSNWSSASGIPGKNLPTAIPAMIHKATQSVKNLSKNDISLDSALISTA